MSEKHGENRLIKKSHKQLFLVLIVYIMKLAALRQRVRGFTLRSNKDFDERFGSELSAELLG